MRKLRLLLFVVLAGVLSSCGYNTMVEKDESVQQLWAQVEAQYQRRADLIPNLVATVKGAADYEKETLTAVIEARSKATSVNIDPSNLDQAALNKFQAAQGELSSALSRLLVSVERYPDIKFNQNFRDLQVQLEGTENRITVARQRFNEGVQGYNGYIRKFPNNLFAGLFGFEKKAYFEAEAGSEKAPEVSF